MRFSKYKGLFMLLSLATLVAFYAITFGKHGGFRHSITFDGGTRISLNMPPGTGKKELNEALAKAGFKDVQTRLANFKTNQYDLEFGPAVQDVYKKKLKEERRRSGKPKKPAANSKDGKDAKKPSPKGDKRGPKKKPLKPIAGQKTAEKPDANSAEEKTVVGEIEKDLLRQLPMISAANVVSREAISASYGDNLTRIAIWSTLWVIAIIGLYLSFRFDVPFALGASMALLHDIILTVGFIGLMQLEPSIPVVAAVLTIIGYSINDTIVIFDRIRENTEKRSHAALELTMDLAITQTLSRTVITSVLTLLAVLALLFGGATSLHDFAMVLLFGVVVGTYSSIFIAAHCVQYYEIFRARRRAA